MPASVFDYTAIRARLDELGERQRRILVVDDLKIMVELLATYLESEHYVVSEALDGLQALAKIATEQPDLVVMDFMMPKMDGAEACRRIRADPVTARTPVLMMSAVVGIEHVIFEAGADDFLLKPFDLLALLARIRGLLPQQPR